MWGWWSHSSQHSSPLSSQAENISFFFPPCVQSFQQLWKQLKMICVVSCLEEEVELKGPSTSDPLIIDKWLLIHNRLAFKCGENHFITTLHLRAIDLQLLSVRLCSWKRTTHVCRLGAGMMYSVPQKIQFLSQRDPYVCTYFLAREWICSWGSSRNRCQLTRLSLCRSKALGCQRSLLLGHRHDFESPSSHLYFAMWSARTYGERGGRM